MNDRKYSFRILATIMCVSLAVCSFIIPPAPETITIKISDDKTISTVHDHGAKFFEWLSLLFLALCVWIWRRELKLTGFGPFSGEPLEQQTVEDYRKGEPDTATAQEAEVPQDMSSAALEMEKEELEARKNRIIDLFQHHPALNLSIVSRDLGVTASTAKALLFMLMKEGKIRCDGFPRSALFTLVASPENLAIDRVRKIIETEHLIDSERRFVRVKRRYEVDAVFESKQTSFLVEVKFVQAMLAPSRLDDWIMKFLTVSKEFRAERLICYLVLLVFDHSLLDAVQDQVRKITYDTEGIDIRILVFSKNELEK